MGTSPDPQRLGDYLLERPVARGGMGEIWRARHVDSGQAVAVKRLALEDDPLEERLQGRLMREIRAFQRLDHENIVRCLGSGLDAHGRPYLALEWLEGETLEQRQRRAPLNPAAAGEVARQALHGLAACHRQGVVHRDIKPTNLFLVPDGEGFLVKVLDLGLALLDEQISRLTQAGEIVGTLHYLSPEQARGVQLDLRTDIYSLGVVLYWMVAGRVPFSGEGAAAVLLKIVTERPVPPRRLRPDLPSRLERLILRAMARDPAHRYASTSAMLDDLTAVWEAPTVEPTPDTRPLRPMRAVENRLVSLLCIGGADDPAGAARAIEEAGGRVCRLLGGRLIGLFGLERTVGDEALRSVRAGLAARPAVGAGGQLMTSTVHLEVGEGLQFDKDDLKRATTFLDSLPPGELVLDRATVEQVGERLETAQLGAWEVARSVRESEGAGRRVLGVAVPLVGREAETAAILAVLSRTLDEGGPETVLVLGPPGIGKSRLCHELRGVIQQRCDLVLEGQASAQQSRSPFQLLAQAIRRLAGIHVGQAPDEQLAALLALGGRYLLPDEREQALPFLGEVTGVSVEENAALRAARAEPRVMHERVGAAIEVLLRAATRSGPVGLLLEDLHLADTESLELLRHAPAHLEQAPLFILASARPELKRHGPALFEAPEVTRVELRALGRRALRKLVGTVLGDDIAPELEDIIVERSEGNPYFAEELVSWLANRGVLARGTAGWELRTPPASLELPAGIEAAVQGRLDGLASELKELLKSAAVVGLGFWEDLCEAMGFSDAPRQLQELEAGQFVKRQASSRFAGAREWHFHHALVHEVAGRMLPAERRRPLHLTVARWLEERGEPDAGLLARHYQRGDDKHRAAHHFARAGEQALAEGDLNRAADSFIASLEDPARADISRRLMGLARTYVLLGRYDRAWSTTEEVEEAKDRTWSDLPRFLFLRGRILLGTSRYAAAEEVLGRALDELAEHDRDDLGFEIQHTLFAVTWAQGRYRDAGTIAGRLDQLAAQTARPEQRCAAALASAYYHAVDGDLSASVHLARQAVVHARACGHLYREVDATILLASALELVGLYDEAVAAIGDARPLAQRLKTAYHQANIEACLGRLCQLRREAPAALAHYRAAVEQAGRIGDYRILITALTGEARTLALEGPHRDLAVARELAQRARELAADHAPPSEVEADLALAEVHLARGDTDPATDAARAAVDLLDRLGAQERYEVEILLAAHAALTAAGGASEAAELLDRARRTVTRRGERIADERIRQSYREGVPHNARALA